MKKSPLNGLIIRSAVVLNRDTGYIYACDPKLEEDDIPHAIPFRWQAGAFTRGKCNYDANSVCVISTPETGLVDISGAGYFSVVTAKGSTGGDIVDNSRPPSVEKRIGGFRALSDIAGKAYAVGLRGMVYRLDTEKDWTRMDEGLPDTFDIQFIHGFQHDDLFAVGRKGAMWHFDGREWKAVDLPTSANLTTVRCAGDGLVYIAGHKGLLIRGRFDAWQVLDQVNLTDDIWDLEWFGTCIYASTASNVYRLDDDQLVAVAFGGDAPKSCYQLSTAAGTLWSNGEYDVMSFNGTRWSRIV